MFDFLRKKKNIAKASRGLAIEIEPTQETYGARAAVDSATLLSAFERSPWMYACVDVIAAAPAQVPWQVLASADKDADELDNAAVIAWMQNPNNYQSFDDFLYTMLAQLETAGDAYIELVSDAATKEAHLLPPSKMKIKPSRMDRIDSYLYEVNGRKLQIARENIVHAQYPHPNGGLYGMPPAKALEQELTTEFFAVGHLSKFLENHARRTTAWFSDQALDDDAWKRAKEMLKSMREHRNAGRDVLFDSGIRPQPLDVTPEEMEFQVMRRWNREAVLAAFGVPPVMVGIFEYANYANSREQIKIFWQRTMPPKLRKVENALTKCIRAIFKLESAVFRFRDDQIPAVQETRQDTVSAVMQSLNAGIITPNEARKQLGMEPSPDEGMDAIWMPMGRDRINELTAPVEVPDFEPDDEQVAAQTDKKPRKPLTASGLNGNGNAPPGGGRL